MFSSKLAAKAIIFSLFTVLFFATVASQNPGPQLTGGGLSSEQVPPFPSDGAVGSRSCGSIKHGKCGANNMYCNDGSLTENCNLCPPCQSGFHCNEQGHCEADISPMCDPETETEVLGPEGKSMCVPIGERTGDCSKCIPSIQSLDYGGGTLTQGKTVNLTLGLGDESCTASKAVLIVSTRKQILNFNTYWHVFNYPVKNEFASVKAAFDSIFRSEGEVDPNKSTRDFSSEVFLFYQFWNFTVDAQVKDNPSNLQDFSLPFTSEQLDPPFKEKMDWLADRNKDYEALIPRLNVASIPKRGFFEATREGTDDKFIEGMNFKFAVKYNCDGRWKFSDFQSVPFTDAGAVVKTCTDGTPYGECYKGSDPAKIGTFCNQGTIEDCTSHTQCCPSGTTCQSGKCVASSKNCTYEGTAIPVNTCVYKITSNQSHKPIFCDASASLVAKCSGANGSASECGCPPEMNCQADGTCKTAVTGPTGPGPQRTPGNPPVEIPPFQEGGGTSITGGGLADNACYIVVQAEFNGTTYDSSKTVTVDSSSIDSISVKGKFSLSQEGCAIEAGAQYGFWDNSSFLGSRKGGGTITAEQATQMSNKQTVEIPGIVLAGIKGFNGSKFFGITGKVKPKGATQFSPKNSATIAFQFGSGGTTTPPGENKCSDGTIKNNCSATKPKYCNESLEFVDNCRECGCPANSECQADGSCKEIVPLAGCDPCQSIAGCLACIDKAMAEQTLK
ncbi:MAG: hypothetical protein QXK06_05105 [Candidatus Diapherotrites archaeon]